MWRRGSFQPSSIAGHFHTCCGKPYKPTALPVGKIMLSQQCGNYQSRVEKSRAVVLRELLRELCYNKVMQKSTEAQKLNNPVPIADIIKNKKKPSKTPNKMGRPNKYRKIFCSKIVEYFESDVYMFKEVEHFGRDGKLSFTEKIPMGKKLPTLIGFAKSINVDVRSLYYWMDEKNTLFQPEFFRTFKDIVKDYQKEYLIQNGLLGTYNPIFAKFVACNLTDMKDKVTEEHTGKDGEPLTIDIHSKESNEIYEKFIGAMKEVYARKEPTQ